MRKISRALISVSDKTGIVELGRELEGFGVEILSTGGTMKALQEAGIKVRSVSEYTGFPEMMDGRVKTLHPRIHGGLLALRDDADHMAAAKEHGIELIDLVVVNLYPFQQTVAKQGVTLEEAIENIDIGGPSMLRSAAKNHRDVAVVVNPARYAEIIAELKANEGALSFETRQSLAHETFQHTAEYDMAIAEYLETVREGATLPSRLYMKLQKVQSLRYGENPHQAAAFYRDPRFEPGVATAEIVHGKALSYNNILDLDAALALVQDIDMPAASVIKHTNPCGAGIGTTLAEAYERAQQGDPEAAYGSIVGVNRVVDADTARLIASPQTFVEAIIAPGYEQDAIPILTESQRWGKNLRILKTGDLSPRPPGILTARKVSGGCLMQELDTESYREADLKVVTSRAPTDAERDDLLFAWVVCKHVKSNAVVFAKEGTVVGVGAGQMKRKDCCYIAAKNAGDKAKGAVVASDAFFPFRDGVDIAAEAGATAIIQPGGSLRDEDAIAAADEHGMAMIFTGMRHFKH